MKKEEQNIFNSNTRLEDFEFDDQLVSSSAGKDKENLPKKTAQGYPIHYWNDL